MSAHKKQPTAASEPNAAEQNSKAGIDFSPELIEERIKAILKPFHARISAQTQMMNKLIQDNLARAYPTASARDRWFRPNLHSQTIPELSEACR